MGSRAIRASLWSSPAFQLCPGFCSLSCPVHLWSVQQPPFPSAASACLGATPCVLTAGPQPACVSCFSFPGDAATHLSPSARAITGIGAGCGWKGLSQLPPERPATLHHCPRTAALLVSVEDRGFGGCPFLCRPPPGSLGRDLPACEGQVSHPGWLSLVREPEFRGCPHKLGALFPSGEVGGGATHRDGFILSLRPGDLCPVPLLTRNGGLAVRASLSPCPSQRLPVLSSPENWLQSPSLPPWGVTFPTI